jgi:hypothetical protein
MARTSCGRRSCSTPRTSTSSSSLRRLSCSPPLPIVARWRARGEAQGIRSTGDVRRDAFAIVGWLIDRVDWIAPLPALEESEDFLFTLIRRHRARYLGARDRRKSRRLCPLCRTGEVVVTFVEAPLSTKGERAAKCSLCGEVYG